MKEFLNFKHYFTFKIPFTIIRKEDKKRQ
jgi:hypothetical protein